MLLISQCIVFVMASILMFPHSWVIFQSIMWLYGLFFFVLYEFQAEAVWREWGECFRCPWCIFRNALGRLLSCREKNGWVFSETASLLQVQTLDFPPHGDVSKLLVVLEKGKKPQADTEN